MTDDLLGAFRPVWWPLLLDVVYAPWPTPLAQRWGGPVVGGFEMLLHQAVAQVELMTGREGPVEAMRAAGWRPSPTAPAPERPQPAVKAAFARSRVNVTSGVSSTVP